VPLFLNAPDTLTGRAVRVAATRARSHLTVVGDPDVAQAYGFADLADQQRASSGRRRRV
jgi:superfamily I DNA and/or RNA helicase